ncbi:MAG: M61 family peptidase [Candidatus Eremiobacteraeota bacterium]|nr:M61 family peptidase [Candidatus Eremiobacteraeota bacterium]
MFALRRLRFVASFALVAALGAGLPARGLGATGGLDRSLATAANPMTVVLDERLAPRGIAYAHMTIPVAPGPFTLDYPEWIPGEHGPTGPLHDMSELKISANGQAIPWERDPVDMYAFHITVPPGVNRVNADFTVLLNVNNDFTDGQLATRNTMVGNWNRYILYQRNVDNTKYFVTASLILPPAWDYASALPVKSRSGARIDFETVTLETLVDSPTDSGRYYKHILTWSQGGARTYLDMFADHQEDLNLPKAELDAYKRMTPEAIALYGGRHWNVYHSELTLSDLIPGQGIEHHQSSDDRAGDDFMTDNNEQLNGGDLLTHEFSHSWNGKYRRPFDLQQPNFNQPYPERTELLWQYEGMNQYMGDLIAFRSGIKGKPADYPEYLALIYEQMAYEPGRNTTPIIDTTTGAPYYYANGGPYGSLRRSAGDFYTEGELMWLDVDTLIRKLTNERKSLDDYTKAFAGGTSSPRVVTYTRADIERYLNEVVPYDWHGLFEKYVYSISPKPPTDMIERAGYRFVITDKPNKYGQAGEKTGKVIDSWLDAGLHLTDEGKIEDVLQGSPAWNDGFGVGMTIVSINDREFTPDAWHAAIKATSSSFAPLRITVEQDEYFKELVLHYHGGLKYAHLQRIPGTTDMLTLITQPHAK